MKTIRKFNIIVSLVILATHFLNNKIYSQAQEQIIFRFSVILVKTKAEADEVLTKLKAGVDFAELVKQYSNGPNRQNGGDLGFCFPTDFNKKLEEKASELAIGQYSEIIEISDRYVILKKTEQKVYDNSEARSHLVKKPVFIPISSARFKNIYEDYPFLENLFNSKIYLYKEIIYKPMPSSPPIRHGNFVTPRLGGGLYSYTEDYFYIKGGPIQKVNYSNLKWVLADNSEAMKYLQDYRKLRNLEVILASTGIGMMLTGVILSMYKDQAETTILVGGAITANLAWIPHFMKKDKIKKAIITYNKNK